MTRLVHGQGQEGDPQAGLLQKIQPTDDEIVEVMGHEIFHVVASHTAGERSWDAVPTVAVAGVSAGPGDRGNAGLH